MMKTMKVLYIAAECKPFSKTGGVGDVAGELPVALKEQGMDIEIVTPWYGRTALGDHRLESLDAYSVEFHRKTERVEIAKTVLKAVPINFIKNPTYFERDYSTDGNNTPFSNPYLFKKDYSLPYVDSDPIAFYDDALRFSFFSEACLDIIEKNRPDIVHANDWVLGYLFGRMAIKRMPQKRVLTIHNIGYQGNVGRTSIKGWDIEQIAEGEMTKTLFADPHQNWNSVNALRLAMELAHRVNAVSPTYAKEITQPEEENRYFEGGKGLHEVAKRLVGPPKRLYGILNGFEYRFPPDKQQFEAVVAEKAKMKAALSKDFKVRDGLLLGFVGRAVEQKFKLLAEKCDSKSVLEHILDMPGVNVAVLATGQKEYEEFLKQLAGRPNFIATIAFDRTKAKQISLGSDVFLMPSLFEPCGITQMECLSWATPPLVRWTGGLVDTVKSHKDTSSGTGFGFDGETREEVLRKLIDTVQQVLQFYTNNKDEFQKMQWRGFNERFFWSTSAKEYIKHLYEPVLASP
jgi:starch synthase